MTDHDGRSDAWLSLGLAFVGGYGDATSFVLAKTFTGHVTGNLVLGAISIAAGDERAIATNALAIACFVAGILLSVWIARPLRAASMPLMTGVMAVEVALIAAGSVAYMSPMALRTGIFVACVALGMQNGAFRRAGGIGVHTTYMTGMITNFITAETQSIAAEHGADAAKAPTQQMQLQQHGEVPSRKMGLLCAIWAVFVLGAGIGAAMAFRFGGYGMMGAAAVLAALALWNWRVEASS